MAVEMRTETPGMTAEQAEPFLAQLRAKLPTYPGFIAHASGAVESGYWVAELWESREAHERWFQEVIAPMIAQAGVADAPAVEYREVVAVITR